MRHNGRSRAWLVRLLAVLAVALGPAGADAGLTLRLEPVQSSVAAGAEATVDVFLDSAAGTPDTNINGFTVRLQTTGGEFTGGTYPGAPGAYAADALFAANTGAFFAANPFDANNNLLPNFPGPKIVLADTSENEQPPGSGVFYDTITAGQSRRLGVVTFAAPSSGQYTVSFDTNDLNFSLLSDPDGHSIPVDGFVSATIDVTPSAVPAPPAAGLLALGAALLPAFRRWGLRR